MYLLQSSLKFCDTNLVGNSARSGGIAGVRNSSVSSTTSNFTANRAQQGGVVYIWKSTSVSFSAGNFASNKVERYGGVVCAWFSSGIVFTAVNFTEQDGGVLYAVLSNVTFARSNFSSNRAVYLGGVVSAYSRSNVSFSISFFTSNRADKHGGVVSAQTESRFSFSMSNFTRNSAEEKGGVVCSEEESTVSFSQSSFASNTAYDGGVLFVLSSRVTFLTSEFTFNRAEEQGGVVYGWYSSSVTFSLSHFAGNRAAWYGGVMFAHMSSNISFSTSSFIRNRADEYGGVLFVLSTKSITFTTTNFTSNSAGFSGGVVHADGSNIIFSSSHFSQNGADDQGAVVFAQEAVISLYSGTMEENAALHGGAGLFGSKSCVHLENFVFQKNSGTAVVLQEHYVFGNMSQVRSCIFTNNVQNTSLFGIDIFSSAIVLENVTVFHTDHQEKSRSITVLGEVEISSVNIILEKGVPFPVAILTKLMWQSSVNNIQVNVKCPDFLKPSMQITSTTEKYASVVQVSCEQCFEGYFLGNRSSVLSLSENTIDGQNCQEQRDQDGGTIYAFCSSIVRGMCHACPYGADCSSGIKALPNYWSHNLPGEEISLIRCPSDYCCEQFPCSGLDSCSSGRGGTVCGRCKTGFTEAFLSQTCVENTETNNHWFLWAYIGWIVATAVYFFFMTDVKNFGDAIKSNVKILCSTKCDLKQLTPASKSTTDIESSEEHDSQPPEKPLEVHSKGIWKVSKPDPAEKEKSHSSTLKYIQIFLFYIQDASLFQVDLPNTNSDSENQSKFSQLVFGISHLAVDVVNFGKLLSLTNDMTPIPKLIIKNITGPSVLLLYVTICVFFQLMDKCLTFPDKHKSFMYNRLVTAALFSLGFFFQKIATSSLSLLHCVQVGHTSVLHIDGHMECYQQWQIGAFVVVFGWVIPFVLVLLFGPGLVGENKISVGEFFLSCLFPIPLLIWWILKRRTGQLKCKERNVSSWQSLFEEELQKTYKKISLKYFGPICWIGVIKSRRLFLAVIFTFAQNIVVRIEMMVVFTLLFFWLHLVIYPYRDKRANQLFAFTLVAAIFLGLLNGVKAVLVEG